MPPRSIQILDLSDPEIYKTLLLGGKDAAEKQGLVYSGFGSDSFYHCLFCAGQSQCPYRASDIRTARQIRFSYEAFCPFSLHAFGTGRRAICSSTGPPGQLRKGWKSLVRQLRTPNLPDPACSQQQIKRVGHDNIPLDNDLSDRRLE